MYLSRLLLEARDRRVRRDLADCQAMHRRVMSGFPSAGGTGRARESFGVLYRLEGRSGVGGVALLVQSLVEPEWGSLPAGYLGEMNDGENPACKSVAAFYDSLEAGTSLRFRLRANPTRRVSPRSESERSGGYGKRVEIYDERGRLEWLARKAERHGFSLKSVRAYRDVPNVRVAPEGKVTGRRDTGDGGHAHVFGLSFGSVLFDGELTVTDAGFFRQGLRDGIGTGKAYGFGLLSVAPTRP
jgi:CRISPR system Cascade subunit CasE